MPIESVDKLINIDLSKLEKKLTPIKTGHLLGRAVRHVKIGFEKLIRYFKSHEWISNQEHALNKLEKHFIDLDKNYKNFLEALVNYRDKPEIKKDIQEFNIDLLSKLEKMLSICDLVARKAPDKVKVEDLNRLKAQIQAFKEKCQQEEEHLENEDLGLKDMFFEPDLSNTNLPIESDENIIESEDELEEQNIPSSSRNREHPIRKEWMERRQEMISRVKDVRPESTRLWNTFLERLSDILREDHAWDPAQEEKSIEIVRELITGLEDLAKPKNRAEERPYNPIPRRPTRMEVDITEIAAEKDPFEEVEFGEFIQALPPEEERFEDFISATLPSTPNVYDDYLANLPPSEEIKDNSLGEPKKIASSKAKFIPTTEDKLTRNAFRDEFNRIFKEVDKLQMQMEPQAWKDHRENLNHNLKKLATEKNYIGIVKKIKKDISGMYEIAQVPIPKGLLSKINAGLK